MLNPLRSSHKRGGKEKKKKNSPPEFSFPSLPLFLPDCRTIAPRFLILPSTGPGRMHRLPDPAATFSAAEDWGGWWVEVGSGSHHRVERFPQEAARSRQFISAGSASRTYKEGAAAAAEAADPSSISQPDDTANVQRADWLAGSLAGWLASSSDERSPRFFFSLPPVPFHPHSAGEGSRGEEGEEWRHYPLAARSCRVPQFSGRKWATELMGGDLS